MPVVWQRILTLESDTGTIRLLHQVLVYTLHGIALELTPERGVRQCCVLPGRRIVDGLFQGYRRPPLVRRTGLFFWAHLIDVPVDLKHVTVRITKFDCDLAAGASSAGKLDRYVVFFKMVPRPKHLIESLHLERHMMKLAIVDFALRPANQRDAVVIVIESQEHHLSRHHAFRIDIRYPKAQHFRIEISRALNILDHHNDVAELGDGEGHLRWRRKLPEGTQIRIFEPFLVNEVAPGFSRHAVTFLGFSWPVVRWGLLRPASRP
ncbi:uncharacterized protein METZ01_LOCUS230019, partial [marine metagenome]